jgi:hypothetical protein
VIRRRVVDDDQLVVADVAGRDELLAHVLGEADRPIDVRLFVPHREEDAERLRHPTEGSPAHAEAGRDIRRYSRSG